MPRCWAADLRIWVIDARSDSMTRATNVASAPRASDTGLNGLSTDPMGEDLVTWPTWEVGEYWPLVNP